MRALTGYFRNIYRAVLTTLIGMTVTGRYAFRAPVTLRYPEEKHKVPERYRGILHNKIEDCIGCYACARACPVDCIHIKTTKRHPDNHGKASDGTPIKLWTTQFDIDMALCMECGLCTYPCPTECLTMTHEYELAVNDKKGMYLEFATRRDREMAQADAERLAREKGNP
jgi:NADH-quinone oxidoreductase subunit I